jgi:hypothetical protein
MAAQVVSVNLKLAEWTNVKPKEYPGKDLDKALKAMENVKLSVPLPADPISVPKVSISSFDTTMKQMKADLQTLTSSHTLLKEVQSAANAVSSAAGKTNAELQAMAKDKKTSEEQKKKFEKAAEIALAIGAKASTLANQIK